MRRRFFGGAIGSLFAAEEAEMERQFKIKNEIKKAQESAKRAREKAKKEKVKGSSKQLKFKLKGTYKTKPDPVADYHSHLKSKGIVDESTIKLMQDINLDFFKEVKAKKKKFKPNKLFGKVEHEGFTTKQQIKIHAYNLARKVVEKSKQERVPSGLFELSMSLLQSMSPTKDSNRKGRNKRFNFVYSGQEYELIKGMSNAKVSRCESFIQIIRKAARDRSITFKFSDLVDFWHPDQRQALRTFAYQYRGAISDAIMIAKSENQHIDWKRFENLIDVLRRSDSKRIDFSLTLQNLRALKKILLEQKPDSAITKSYVDAYESMRKRMVFIN